VPPSFLMPPPLLLPTFPLLIVRSEIVTTLAPIMKKTREALLPLTVRTVAPGPKMVRLSVMSNSPVVSVIVPVTLKIITSAPGFVFESRMACLSEPNSLSFRLVTVKLATGAVNDPVRWVIRNPLFSAAPELLGLHDPTNTTKDMSNMYVSDFILID
jgi:hypothetical protein